MYALSLILLLCLSAQTINGENRNDGQAIGFKNNTLHGYAMNCEIIALSNTDVAQKIAKRFDKELIVPAFRQFADGEVNVKLDNYERYEDKTVVIVQSTGRRVNEYTLGVAFLAQELKHAGAKKVIAVIPYLGYARQDKSSVDEKPGHVSLIAKLFEQSGIDELIAVELHDEDIIKLFTIPVTNVSVRDTIAAHITKQFPQLDSVCLVAPDKGAREYVKAIAKQMDVGTITFSKERFGVDQTRVVGCLNECDGIIGIVIDDIISTGGTAINVCSALPEMGYATISGYFVHPVLAANALERMRNSCFRSIFVSNTLPLSPEMNDLPFITVFDISEDIVSVLKDKLET